MISQLLFVLMALFALVGACGVVAARRTFLSALSLILALFGVAGLYVLLEAGLLAMLQILIYIGAIGVLILFTIMLTRMVMTPGPQSNRTWFVALALAVGLGGLLIALAFGQRWPLTDGAVLPPEGGTVVLGSEPAAPEVVPTTTILGAEPQADETGRKVMHVPGTISMLGIALMTRHLLAFELISAILLVALLGAVIIARE